MLGDLVTRILVLVCGYAYPAFECFKSIEKNPTDIEQHRFWCHYWIIVALLTVLERVGDTFISWLPMYGEAKLALFLYLWHPKTKGTNHVYENFVTPFIATHETTIDSKLVELRGRALAMATLYWKHLAGFGHNVLHEFLQYLAAQASVPTPTPTAQKSRHQTTAS